jgi:pimeloyl-ACP methyl ester carboxylesterase
MNATTWDTHRLTRRWTRLDHGAITGTRPGIRVLELPTTRVRVRVAGTGPVTLVFVCDPPNVVEQYDDVIARLGPRHRIVVMESPGFGFSFPKAGFGFTRHEFADVQVAVLCALDLAPYVLVAPCVASFAALTAAAANPTLITKLVLMQATSWSQQKVWLNEVAKSFVLGTLGLPFGNRLGAVPFLAQALFGLGERRFPELTHPVAVYRSRERRALLAKFLEPGTEAFRQGACNCMPSLYQRYFSDGEAAIGSPRQPTLVLWANRDFWHDSEAVEEQFSGMRGLLLKTILRKVASDKRGLLEYVPHATFAEIAETGHHLELENPAEVCLLIEEFVNAGPR